MPSFTPMGNYNLTITQIDLILYALNQVEMNQEEDNERRKIAEVFYTASVEPNNYPPDPYLEHYYTCDY
jgi:hypothetical protein